jgi:hypothetical protein
LLFKRTFTYVLVTCDGKSDEICIKVSVPQLWERLLFIYPQVYPGKTSDVPSRLAVNAGNMNLLSFTTPPRTLSLYLLESEREREREREIVHIQ